MRSWIFHPLVFYPLILLIAGLAIFISLEPQSWRRAPTAVAGRHEGAALVWSGTGFDSPDIGPEQRMYIERDFFGRAQVLRIAELPGQPPPTPAERGLRLLFTPADAALLNGKAVTAEVSYNPLPINNATSMALSMQGTGPAAWVTLPAPSPPQGALKFELPAQVAPDSVGIRVIAGHTDEAFGLEITRVKLTPHD